MNDWSVLDSLAWKLMLIFYLAIFFSELERYFRKLFLYSFRTICELIFQQNDFSKVRKLRVTAHTLCTAQTTKFQLSSKVMKKWYEYACRGSFWRRIRFWGQIKHICAQTHVFRSQTRTPMQFSWIVGRRHADLLMSCGEAVFEVCGVWKKNGMFNLFVASRCAVAMILVCCSKSEYWEDSSKQR